MQKKVVLFILTLLVLGASTLLIAQINQYHARKKWNRKQSEQFPVTNLLSLQQNYFNTGVLADSPVYKLIVLFDPDCDHCAYEMEEITRHGDQLKQIATLFITPKPVKELEQMAAAYPDIQAFSLPYGELKKHFDCTIFPEIYLYGKNNKLIKSFYGKTTAPVILSALNR